MRHAHTSRACARELLQLANPALIRVGIYIYVRTSLSFFSFVETLVDSIVTTTDMDDTNNSGTLLALQVIDVNKFYGRGPSAYHVLHSLNMDVPQGTM